MTVQRIDPPTLTEPMQGLYTQIAIAPTGRLAFISGQTAYKSDGSFVGLGDLRQQAHQAFSNLSAAIEAAGATPAQVVRMTIYVVNYKLALARTIFAAAKEVFGENWPISSSVLLGVGSLAMDDWLIEVDAIASLDP